MGGNPPNDHLAMGDLRQLPYFVIQLPWDNAILFSSNLGLHVNIQRNNKTHAVSQIPIGAQSRLKFLVLG